MQLLAMLLVAVMTYAWGLLPTATVMSTATFMETVAMTSTPAVLLKVNAVSH